MKQATLFLVMLWLLVFWPPPLVAEDLSIRGHIPVEVDAVVRKYCGDCHGSDTAEADVSFDGLVSWDAVDHLKVLNLAEEQLLFGLMPPDDADQPSAKERALLAEWLREQLSGTDASSLDKKRRYPEYGNYIDHETLFSGKIRAKGFSPARRWLVSPQFFMSE